MVTQSFQEHSVSGEIGPVLTIRPRFSAREIACLLGPNETTIYLLHLVPFKVSSDDPIVTSASDGVRLGSKRVAFLNQAAAGRLERQVRYRILISFASHWSRADIVLGTAVKVQAGLIVIATTPTIWPFPTSALQRCGGGHEARLVSCAHCGTKRGRCSSSPAQQSSPFSM